MANLRCSEAGDQVVAAALRLTQLLGMVRVVLTSLMFQKTKIASRLPRGQNNLHKNR
jgi:hypothetical protein